MKNNLPIYILLCLLNLSWVHARNRQQEAETLIKKSVDALYNNPKQASYYAAKVIELFPEERQNNQKAEARLCRSCVGQAQNEHSKTARAVPRV